MKTRAPLFCACLLAMASALPFATLASEPVVAADSAQVAPDLQAAIAANWRSPANVARDNYRHPAQTLAFFGLQPNQTVVEITPGGGWYAEILAPYLRGHGHYVAAVVDPMALPAGKGRDYQQRTRDGLEKKFAAAPALFDKATVVAYDPAAPVLGKPGSADVVLTFRNVHNWRAANQAEGLFRAFFAVLKPGGTLGVVEHRAKADVRGRRQERLRGPGAGDRDGRGRRFQPGPEQRDQRQPGRHQGPSQWCLDPAAVQQP